MMNFSVRIHLISSLSRLCIVFNYSSPTDLPSLCSVFAVAILLLLICIMSLATAALRGAIRKLLSCVVYMRIL